MWARIILHQNEIVTNCSCKRSYNRTKNSIGIPQSSQWTSIYHIQVSVVFIGNPTPYHYWPSSICVHFHNIAVLKSLFWPSSDQNTSIRSTEMKPAFICKQNCAPVLQSPVVLMRLCKIESLCTMLPGENKASCWSSGVQITFMQSVTFCLVGYSLTSCMMELDLWPSGRKLPIS